MIRKTLIVVCLFALAAGAAFAGDTNQETGSDPMAMHMAAMMSCDVCKTMLPHMETLAPAMTMDVALLNDGIAMMHGVSDPAVLDLYRSVSADMSKAGEACMAYSDEDADAKLCHYCQGVRGVMQSGAKMSMGPTQMGDVMVITSDDPEVQKQLADLGAMCQQMCEMMHPSM